MTTPACRAGSGGRREFGWATCQPNHFAFDCESAATFSADNAFPNCMAYNLAKAALDMMMKTAATELLPHRIRVNAVYPGWTDTPGEREFSSDEGIRHAAAELPLGRLATAEEVAGSVLYLAGPQSSYATGTILHLDDGLFLPW